MAIPTVDGIRDTLYLALYAAISENGGYLFRGRNGRPGPQVGLGRLTDLQRWEWIDVVRVEIVKRGQKRHEIAGGWLTAKGRAALRAEILRRGDKLPARLAEPAPKRARVAGGRTVAPARRAAPAPRIGAPAGAVVVRTPVRTVPAPAPAANRPVTADVDPFALIGAALSSRADAPIPF